MPKADCICCGFAFTHQLKQNLCNECRKVVDKLETLPPQDPYRDVLSARKAETEAAEKPGKRRAAVVYNKYTPRRAGQYRSDWKWEGLNPNGSLPDSWWESFNR